MREALQRRILRVRLAVDQQRQDPVAPAELLEGTDLLIHVRRSHGSGRADDEQARALERPPDIHVEVGVGRQFLFVAEDRKERRRDRLLPQIETSDELGRDFVGFEAVVEPRRPLPADRLIVGVAVTYEDCVRARGDRVPVRQWSASPQILQASSSHRLEPFPSEEGHDRSASLPARVRAGA
jgi:hypothetical protein